MLYSHLECVVTENSFVQNNPVDVATKRPTLQSENINLLFIKIKRQSTHFMSDQIDNHELLVERYSDMVFR